MVGVSRIIELSAKKPTAEGSFTFFQRIRSQGSMSEYWISYITMVKTLLDIIRASREGNFLLHLEDVEAIIPWSFAYDRTNYYR